MNVYSTEQEVLQKTIEWYEAGYNVALVTVVKTWGSSPRPVGSLLTMRDDGHHIGSVSGGCVEEDLITRFRNREMSGTFPTMIDYGVDRDEAVRFGLPCGGRLELLIEEIEGSEPLRQVLKTIQAGRLIARRVCLNTGEVSLHRTNTSQTFEYNSDFVQQIFGPPWHMLLIGACHLTRYVATIAMMMNYRVTVCDPRDDFARDWEMEGVRFVRIMPDDAVVELAKNPRSIVITLSHDPKLDDMALMEALISQISYVGALGSKQNQKKRRERLMQLGVTAEQLQRLHAPVGLDIGSRTPPEIAVSIMAEITAIRNRQPTSKPVASSVA